MVDEWQEGYDEGYLRGLKDAQQASQAPVDLERVARAICLAVDYGMDIPSAVEYRWEWYVKHAEAAIAAMQASEISNTVEGVKPNFASPSRLAGEPLGLPGGGHSPAPLDTGAPGTARGPNEDIQNVRDTRTPLATANDSESGDLTPQQYWEAFSGKPYPSDPKQKVSDSTGLDSAKEQPVGCLPHGHVAPIGPLPKELSATLISNTVPPMPTYTRIQGSPAYKAGYDAAISERESSSPPPEMGMKMADVRVGMTLKSLYGGPVITVTEMTEKGFMYSHAPYSLGPRYGQTTGGEHYGYNGYSHYTPVADDEKSRRGPE